MSAARKPPRQEQPAQLIETLLQGSGGTLRASDLARICGVDLKTVHQWATTQTIPHFRTPGRHLRFRTSDVISFLQKAGHPGAAAPGASDVLVLCSRTLEPPNSSLHISWATDPYLTLVEAARREFEAVVIDTRRLRELDVDAYLRALVTAAPDAQLVIVAAARHPANDTWPRARTLSGALSLISG